MKKIFQKMLLSRWTPRIMYSMLGMFAGLFVAYLYIKSIGSLDILPLLQVAAPGAILLSVMLASRQFVYNTEWNKKESARQSLGEFVKRYNRIIQDLHPILNIRDCIRNRTRINICDIHNHMGVFVCKDDGYEFVYHGVNTQEDIKRIHNKDNCYRKNFDNSIDGMKVERDIISLLNEFEYLAAFVSNGTLDKEIVVKLLGATIVNAYFVFEAHIHHLRKDFRHGQGKNERNRVYRLFEELAKDIASNDINSDIVFDAIKDDQVKTPFDKPTLS